MFFFYCNDVHRNLHSFPTRRSSDLRSGARDRARASESGDDPALDDACHRCGCRASRPLGEAPERDARSEEHTSELQSLTKLVCRFLLEKKKYYNKYIINDTKLNNKT